MSAATAGVDLKVFTPAYLSKGEAIFLRPSPQYTWQEVVSGADVQSQAGGTRRMFAVDQKTTRAFHRVVKACPGAKEELINYFMAERGALIDALHGVRTRDDLNRLSNRICDDIRTRLTNFTAAQLRPYNMVRKPVDLFLEHLVAMAVELDEVRPKLVPLLYVPLDSWILQHPGLFTDHELSTRRLSRASTYKHVASELTHAELQALLADKAGVVAEARGRAFHPIYFDLIWNHRYRRWGGNLFESNP